MCKEKLLSNKELAKELNRSESYVRYMIAAGYKTYAGRSTLKSALTWLETHPHPCTEGREKRLKRR